MSPDPPSRSDPEACSDHPERVDAIWTHADASGEP